MSKPVFVKKELNVLVIDDNEQITKMISTFLKLNKHRCTIANDGKHGLELLKQDEFDVILLDLAMPDLDGYDILGKIKSDEIISKTIILTASNITKETKEKLERRGINTILQKPVDIDTILKKITDLTNS